MFAIRNDMELVNLKRTFNIIIDNVKPANRHKSAKRLGTERRLQWDVHCVFYKEHANRNTGPRPVASGPKQNNPRKLNTRSLPACVYRDKDFVSGRERGKKYVCKRSKERKSPIPG